ncbi:MAG: twin-arginine translocase subunit TatC [Ignavibacteriae bacterium]|nr:twin-arginine translocase subunit TatC [Ignavibacteriota bacterium]
MTKLFNKKAGDETEPREMTFLDHLEELRWHIFKILIGWILATVACGFYAEFIVDDLLLAPLEKVGLKAQVLAPYGIVLLYMQAVLICGFIISMPNTLYRLWRFIAPGLLPKERRYISVLVAFTTILFLGGVAFSYLILIPTALDFFAHFGTQDIELNISIDRYISFVLALLVGAGLVFELPMVSYTLSKIGILTPEFMRHYRRHAIVTILIIAALVTPTPDIVTQLLLGIPMMLLYEVSIVISSIVNKKRNEELAADLPSETVSAGEKES